MSKEIDMENPEAWTDDEIVYLRDRGRLPRDFDKSRVPTDDLDPQLNLDDTPARGDVGTLPPPVFDGEPADEEEIIEEDYEAQTVPELRKELESRGLETDGNKPDLVARLEEDDDKVTV